jgi:hypothetical protein
MAHTFLSNGWLTEAGRLRAEIGDDPFTADITINVTVTGGPEGDRELHFQGGQFVPGHVEAPTSLTVPFGIARQMFVEGDQQAAVQGFMSGQIKVQGDMGKLMQLQASGAATSPQATALAEKLKSITS